MITLKKALCLLKIDSKFVMGKEYQSRNKDCCFCNC